MSNRKCNFCCHTSTVKSATKQGKEVKVIPKPTGTFPRGVDVHVGSPGFTPSEQTWQSWYVVLPKVCEC